MCTIDTLYDEGADIYAAFSYDRDFAAQAMGLRRLTGPENRSINTLELFAGPAWHTHELSDQGRSFAVAVDSAQGMKDFAVAQGHVPDDRYVVTTLPCFGESFPQVGFHLATILRYSIGYLAPLAVEVLFGKLATMMAPDGVIAVELHDLTLARTGFSALGIRERTILTPSGTKIVSAWPSAPPTWNEDEWQVIMPLTVSIQRTGCEPVIREYTSTEYIYSVGEILRIAERTNAFTQIEGTSTLRKLFPDSRLLLLVRR